MTNKNLREKTEKFQASIKLYFDPPYYGKTCDFQMSASIPFHNKTTTTTTTTTTTIKKGNKHIIQHILQGEFISLFRADIKAELAAQGAKPDAEEF